MQLPALVDLTCKQITELAHAFMTPHGLRVADRARFEQHLHACTWCMTYMQQLGETVRAARRLAHEPAPSDPRRVLALFRAVAQPAVRPAVEEALAPQRAAGRRTVAPSDVGAQYGFKFLARGAVGALSGFAWPRPDGAQPGAWVEVAGPLAPCERGIHACSAGDLAHWLHDELWVVELGGEMCEGVDAMVAARGRLVREVSGWRLGGGVRFAHAVYERAHACIHDDPSPAPDALHCLASAARHVQRENVSLAAFCAAMAVARQAGRTCFDQAAYDAARREQAALIVGDLGLAEPLSRER